MALVLAPLAQAAPDATKVFRGAGATAAAAHENALAAMRSDPGTCSEVSHNEFLTRPGTQWLSDVTASCLSR